MDDAAAPTAIANGAMLSVEEVTKIIQKMRADQESFLEQQREVIIQQVLESIQRSGALTVGSSSSPINRNTSKKENPLSPTARLEQNLHTLVHHSLAQSGLDFPHVHNTANQDGVPLARGSNRKGHVETSKTSKQTIISRPEVENARLLASTQPESKDDNNEGEDCVEQVEESSARQGLQVNSQSPLRVRIESRRKRSSKVGKRRHRLAPANRSRALHDADDADYSSFVAPVDAAFNAIRKKVDLRTLAILDRSKVLLGQVKQHRSTDGKTSFVDKLRQRHRRAEQPPYDLENTAAGSARDNQPSPSDEPSEKAKDDSVVVNEAAQDAKHASKITPDSIRCDLELLQPPSKSPDNDNEWENELARQILTIYATSVKAKALDKAISNSPEKHQNDNQYDGISGSRSTSKKPLHKATSPRRKSITSSCSLPAIGGSSKPRHRPSASPAAVHYSWEPSQRREDGRVIINMPKVPRPIWFAGTGAVKAVWCALADGFSKLRPPNPSPEHADATADSSSMCDHRLCEQVRQLEAKKKFAQCITTLESLLVALVRARGADELETKLWKQLVVTCNAFASRCIDYQKFPAGLQLMKQAEHLIDNSILVDNTMRMELLAYLYDTYAHYYYRRRKPHAGLQYILKAHEIHSRQSSWAHLAKCRLHVANLLSFQIKHAEAMRYMASILEMIEQSKLEEPSEAGGGGGPAQKLCLAAVCYNNMAVEQLHMREFEAASVSSANAQRLARLCLSYSNRWLSQFQATSDCVALAIATLMEDTNAGKNPFADRKALPMTEDQ